MYLAGSAILRKTFIVNVCPVAAAAALWLQAVIVPVPGTT
jgi:hypothetical protein